MHSDADCTRRDFVKLTAGAALATAAGAARGSRAAEQPARSEAPAGARPRIGCVSWCFHNLGAGNTRPDQAIETIGELGFEGIELILTGRGEIAGYWTDATIDAIRKRLDHFKLQVPQFALFQPVVEGLTSTKADERQQSLDRFEAGCRIAKKLGAPLVNIVAPWPRELSGPGSYLPRYYEVANPKPGEKFHIEIAPGFDWDLVWQTFVDSVKACLERAKTCGLKCTVENHTHTVVPDATALLRLWDAIRDPALGLNLDVGWTALQREYPPVAIYKAHKHLMNVHMRDIDGLMRQFVHVGKGVMDFQAIAKALKAVRFSGFLNLEQDAGPDDMKTTCARYLAMMKECLE
jgi:sugar phosphate isomerase/epimerase